MRILFVTNSLAVGGVEKNIVRLTDELVSRGHEVAVAAQDGSLTPDVLAAGGEHIALHMRPSRPRSLAADVIAVRRHIRARGVDVIHVFSASAALVTLATRIALPRSQRPPVTVSIMGLDNYPGEPAWRIRLRVALATLGARRVIVMAPAIDAVIRHLHLKQSRVVHQSVVGVPLPGPIDHEGARERVRRELGIGDRPMIVTIGRLEPRKSHELFVQSAEEVIASHPEAVLCIVGDGAEESRLRREIDRLRVDSNVRLLGNRSDVNELLRACDVYVRPGIVEGFIGITVLEAQALGVPAVSFDTEDVRLAIQDGQTGLLVPAGDTRALAAAVNRLLEEPAFAAQLGANGKSHLERTYALPAIAASLECLYREVATEGGAR